eukprot:CAMPEP_0170584514 /NCGR_PEP_ID=MMETSP0224-20130122/8724_1 /TAXON_ID=285029 /ORGANISM="Togula jolla, Strain CCCM 725" /LENGTH=674 /DNA_ID=CAMNT_0010907943 /DNA_START=80 /DNA_END=2101 /DNA_ORIENTATION=-
MKATIREQLRSWAADPNLPLEEQKRNVRQLLAQWHPDKNQHRDSSATHVFQFIQEEVNRILSEQTHASVQASKEEQRKAQARERKAQREAERAAKTSALESARVEKQLRKQGKSKGRASEDFQPEPRAKAKAPCSKKGQDEGESGPQQEFSLVIGHGPATTAHLRPWPRSHFSLTPGLLDSRSGEMLMFGGEAYDGRELTFYSDLYRIDLHQVHEDRALPWEKLYSSAPQIFGPEARSSHQSVAWGSFVYIFGGEWSSRDQRRYRQFNDLWRIKVTTPGARWECLEATRAPPPRSGHRMAAGPAGQAVLYGGFCEDRRRRATYMGDLHALDLESATWCPLEVHGDRRSSRPGPRAGCLLWMSSGCTYIFGGVRPKRKGSEQLETMEDLWRARMDRAQKEGVQWELLLAEGVGPGRRSGLCHCALSSTHPGRRLVFGGVLDVQLPASAAGTSARKGSPGGTEVALFHSDLFLLDCETGRAPVWTRLWPSPLTGRAARMPSPSAADAQALALAGGSEAARSAPAPRGRMASGCVVAGGALWIFGGSCEAGPRREVTLDDLWRLELEIEGDKPLRCAEEWTCVLPLSERATMWFDSDSESEDEEDEELGQTHEDSSRQDIVPVRPCAGVLSKRQQKEESKKARMEFKRERQQEKCEEKTAKRDQKKEKQRAEALAKQ